MSFRPRSVANAAAIALVGLLGLTACQSQPSHRRVVLDLIEAEPNLTAAQRDCMTDALNSFTNDQLDQIADDNDALDFSQEDYVGTGSDLYGQYVEALSACYSGEGSAESTEPTGTTEVSDTTDGSDTVESGATTEAADTTESGATTEAPDTTAE